MTVVMAVAVVVAVPVAVAVAMAVPVANNEIWGGILQRVGSERLALTD